MTASDTTRFSGSLTAQRDSLVGVIGLGHMGHAFAANLVADGYQVSSMTGTRSEQRP